MPATVGPGAGVRRLAIHGLGAYAMLMYGITYYAITTAAPQMATDLGLSTSSVFAVISAALLISAALAPRLGRLSDRVGAAAILLAGALLRAGLLAAMALSPEPVTFIAALLLVQVLGQATEYDATFAAAVQLAEDDARTGMSLITLWGGLASTVFWPVTVQLLDAVGWRVTFLLYAAVLLAICGPVAGLIWTLPHMRPQRRPMEHPATADDALVTPDTSRAPTSPAGPGPVSFALVAAAFALGGITYSLPTLMLPVLNGLGLGASAVMVGMIFGPSQTAGRFCDMIVGTRVSAIAVAVVATATVTLAFLVLLAGGLWAAIAFAILFGAGAGVSYVVRGSVVLTLYGRQGYATWLGRLGTIRLMVAALSPLGLALVMEHFGAHAVVAVCGIAVLLSLVCFVALHRQWQRLERTLVEASEARA